jgi:hypothetical protein
MSDIEPTSRRNLLKLFGLGTAALILPTQELVIPATAVDNPDPTVYNNPIFITGNYASFAGCHINGQVVIVGDGAVVHSCYIKVTGDGPAIRFENPHQKIRTDLL